MILKSSESKQRLQNLIEMMLKFVKNIRSMYKYYIFDILSTTSSSKRAQTHAWQTTKQNMIIFVTFVNSVLPKLRKRAFYFIEIGKRYIIFHLYRQHISTQQTFEILKLSLRIISKFQNSKTPFVTGDFLELLYRPVKKLNRFRKKHTKFERKSKIYLLSLSYFSSR